MTLGLSRPAFERVFAEHEGPLFNVVFRWVWSREDADEIVQEAFVRLWDMRRRIDPETVRPLLFRIGLNLASSRRRRGRRPWWRLPPPVPPTPPEEQLMLDEQIGRLRGAVESLPNGQREVIVLCELGGLSYAEVAEVLDIKVGTVGSRRNAAMHRLRTALADEESRAPVV